MSSWADTWPDTRSALRTRHSFWSLEPHHLTILFDVASLPVRVRLSRDSPSLGAMDGLLSKAFDSHEYQSLNDQSASLPQRLKAFGHVFSHRIRRGGLGLLLRVLGLVFGLFVLLHLAPSHLGDYRNVLRWSSKEPAKAADLRIVVFGSQDLVGSSIDTSSDRVTWPERLCKEV